MPSSADCTLGVIPGVRGTPKHCLREITAKAVPGSMLAAKRGAFSHAPSLHYAAAVFAAISIYFQRRGCVLTHLTMHT